MSGYRIVVTWGWGCMMRRQVCDHPWPETSCQLTLSLVTRPWCRGLVTTITGPCQPPCNIPTLTTISDRLPTRSSPSTSLKANYFKQSRKTKEFQYQILFSFITSPSETSSFPLARIQASLFNTFVAMTSLEDSHWEMRLCNCIVEINVRGRSS